MLRTFLYSRTVLILLFWINALGTVYGYYWYKKQLLFTYETMERWLLPFVPDSPTASLFFTLSLAFILYDRGDGLSRVKVGGGRVRAAVRGFVDAFAFITSIKYGIWAVAMILAGGLQGDSIVWEEWMLVVSHLGMAAEALVYAPLLRFGPAAIAAVSAWTLLNDYLDYNKGIFPWLPRELMDDLPAIERFTVALSLVCIAAAWGVFAVFRRRTK